MGNKIIGVVLALTIGVIVLGSVLIPVLEDSERTIEPITEYNIGEGHTYREVRNGDVLELVSTYDVDNSKKTDVWTLNGNTVINPNFSDALEWDIFLMSDVMWGRINSNDDASSGSLVNMAQSTTLASFGAWSGEPNYNLTFTFTDTTLTWTSSNNNIGNGSMPYSWAYVICSLEDGAYRSSSVNSQNFIMSDVDDYILCGTYSSGELDTNYWYYDGTLHTLADGITGETTTTATLKDGTYDLYNVGVTVTVSDGSTNETFEPYRALVPYEVHGHADSGSLISLLELLPFLVIISVLLLAVSIVVRSRY